MESNKTILLVDDDEDILQQLTLTLKGAGYTDIRTAGSQEEGEEVLLSFRPDLAILDLMMEQIDSGFILAHTLKKLYPEVPVILLTAVTAETGFSFSTEVEDARRWAKVDVILDKPVRPEQIKTTIARLFSEGPSLS